MLAALLVAALCPQDLVLANATVWTGTDAAWSGPIVVTGGRIAAPGTTAPAGAVTRDLGGAFVMPGLQDAHGHLLGLGTALEEVDLVGARSFAEVVARVVAASKRSKKGEWIVGRGWDQNRWSDPAMPEHAELSRAVPDHPVWLVRVDGHAAIGNAAAMTAAKLQKDVVAPSGGEILRDGRGEPTGVFVDLAMALVTPAIPDPPPEVTKRRLQRAAMECLRHGLTCVHDAGVSPEAVAAMRSLDDVGEWRLRSYLMWSARHTDRIAAGPWQSADGLLQLRAVKGYADGALGSYGALLLEPYADKPSSRGLPMTAGLGDLAQLCADHGMQLCVHAIGDAANRAVLDAYAATRFEKGREAARFRIEHCQVIHPADFARFEELHVVPSMQPTHLTSDMPWAPARLGSKRVVGAYAWKSFHALGLPVAFGSDFPVEGVDPRLGIYAAVTTRARPGTSPLRPDQQLSRERALRGFTSDAAFAMFAENELGVIAKGMRADLTVFDRDLRTCPEDELLTARVLLTIVDGRIAYAAD